MTTKRSAEDGTEFRTPKSKRHKTTRTDPAATQRGAFGDLENGTTAPGDSDLDCEDDSEALAYLKSVRTQASTIPHVLVAKYPTVPLPPDHTSSGSGGGEGGDGEEPDVDPAVYDNGVGDFRGYYEDGAYISFPDGHWEGNEEEYECDEEDTNKSENDEASDTESQDRPRNSSGDEIRDAYFASITDRYVALRNLLRTDPPDAAVRALPPTNTIRVAEWTRGVGSFQMWENRLRGTDPIPAQIASMHKDSIFRLLRIILASKFLRKRQELRERTSRWIWALLARLPDKGELDHQEVGWIRELGKRAVLMLVSLTELEVLREHCDVAKSSPDEDEYELDAEVDECFEEDSGQDASLDVDDAPSPTVSDEKHEALEQPEVSTSSNARPSNGVVADEKESPTCSSDVEMQLGSDMEEGEVTDAPPSPPSPKPNTNSVAEVEAAKARLLAQFSGTSTVDGDVEDVAAYASTKSASASMPLGKGERESSRSNGESGEAEGEGEVEGASEVRRTTASHEGKQGDGDSERYEELDRGKINERATLNMILTVAGEFYGQRDLLEFRNPFGGLQFG